MPGAFDVQIHYNGTLFAQGTEIEAMQRGNLEVALTSPADIAELIPEYSIFTTGYLIRDPAHLDAIYDGDIGTEYKAKVASDLGLEILKSQYLGTRHVILREPREVMTPADMKGVKLRMPGSAAWQFLGNALGANATPLAFEEVYLAMQTGTIDGLENPMPDAISGKFYEVSKQVVLTGHQVANVFFTFAKPFWDSLTPDGAEGDPRRRDRRQDPQRRGRRGHRGRRQGVPGSPRQHRHDAGRRGVPHPRPRRLRQLRLRQGLAAGDARPDQRRRRLTRVAAIVRLWKRFAETAAVVAFGVMFAAFVIQIASRYLFDAPVAWTQEICLIAYVWVVFWSCDILVPERKHIIFDILYNLAPVRPRRWLAVAVTGSLFVVFLAVLPATAEYVQFVGRRRTTILHIPMPWVYGAFLVFVVALIVSSASASGSSSGPAGKRSSRDRP